MAYSNTSDLRRLEYNAGCLSVLAVFLAQLLDLLHSELHMFYLLKAEQPLPTICESTHDSLAYS